MPYIAQSISYEMQGVANVVKRCFDKNTHQGGRMGGDSLEYLRAFVQNLRNYEARDSLIWQSSDKSAKNPMKISQNIASTAQNIGIKPQIESDFAMIYSLTPRSRLYLEVLKNGGILPSTLLILGEGEAVQEIEAYALSLGLSTQRLSNTDINDQEVFEAVSALSQRYVIYSGYGGGILAPKYFEIPKSFIHIHAGKLPQYRGSTTCYYSLLEEGEICASAMILNQKLDCGDMLGSFSLDIEGILTLDNTDIDTSIEPYIRARALLQALHSYRESAKFMPIAQEIGAHKGETYYRIHPTLKHLALFLCFSQ